jgi:DnaJ-class molecular chaperone
MENVQATPMWQLCPKCDGEGNLTPLFNNTTGAAPNEICDVCGGKKIISVLTGLPPVIKNESYSCKIDSDQLKNMFKIKKDERTRKKKG